MKIRLLAQGILSIVSMIMIIIFLATADLERGWWYAMKMWDDKRFWSFIFYASSIATLILGIITLAKPKEEQIRGLTIASGVLSILCILWFVNLANAIVTFITAFKVKETNQNQPKQEPNLP